jgi:hypothetical protein
MLTFIIFRKQEIHLLPPESIKMQLLPIAAMLAALVEGRIRHKQVGNSILDTIQYIT